MYQIVPEPAFSAWFERLAESAAEDVASALEVVAKAGGALEPARVTRALLWFDGVGSGGASVSLDLRWLSLVDSAESARTLVGFERDVLACLDSAAFRERLARLDAERAAQTLARVERLRRRVRAFQRELVLELGASRGPSERLAARKAELAEAFEAVLRAAGLAGERLFRSESGLRELTLGEREPPLRVLFGLDATRGKLVAILGEALDRSYYGDSVRFAEARWARYQQSVLRSEVR
jgi:hypothetical protein